MAIYNSKNNTWETKPLTEWNDLKISYGRFISYDIKSFKVKHLQLTDFKGDIITLKDLNLISLDLSNNYIKDIDIELKEFITLRELNLSCNSLTSFNSIIVESLLNLEKLDLSNNFITYLKPFKSNSIKWLVLSSNPLQNINQNIFQHLSAKCSVFLYNCRIKNDVEKSLVYPHIIVNVDLPRSVFTKEDKDKAWSVFIESLKNEDLSIINDQIEKIRLKDEKTTYKYILNN